MSDIEEDRLNFTPPPPPPIPQAIHQKLLDVSFHTDYFLLWGAHLLEPSVYSWLCVHGLLLVDLGDHMESNLVG